LIEHVLKGGQLPGVPSDVLESIVKQYLAKIKALTAYNKQLLLTSTSYPIENGFLPPHYATNVLEEHGLSHVSLKTHSIPAKIPIPEQNNYLLDNTTSNFQLSPQLIQMMKLIPPGYNLSNLPKEVTQQIMRGEMPDLTLLPTEILQYIRDNSDELFQAFTSMVRS
jgi:hypothetical protein